MRNRGFDATIGRIDVSGPQFMEVTNNSRRFEKRIQKGVARPNRNPSQAVMVH